MAKKDFVTIRLDCNLTEFVNKKVGRLQKKHIEFDRSKYIRQLIRDDMNREGGKLSRGT